MIDHRAFMDHLLGIDERHDEMALLLTKALVALRMSRPSNSRSAEQIAAARRGITQALRRAA